VFGLTNSAKTTLIGDTRSCSISPHKDPFPTARSMQARKMVMAAVTFVSINGLFAQAAALTLFSDTLKNR